MLKLVKLVVMMLVVVVVVVLQALSRASGGRGRTEAAAAAAAAAAAEGTKDEEDKCQEVEGPVWLLGGKRDTGEPMILLVDLGVVRICWRAGCRQHGRPSEARIESITESAKAVQGQHCFTLMQVPRGD